MRQLAIVCALKEAHDRRTLDPVNHSSLAGYSGCEDLRWITNEIHPTYRASLPSWEKTHTSRANAHVTTRNHRMCLLANLTNTNVNNITIGVHVLSHRENIRAARRTLTNKCTHTIGVHVLAEGSGCQQDTHLTHHTQATRTIW